MGWSLASPAGLGNCGEQGVPQPSHVGMGDSLPPTMGHSDIHEAIGLWSAGWPREGCSTDWGEESGGSKWDPVAAAGTRWDPVGAGGIQWDTVGPGGPWQPCC